MVRFAGVLSDNENYKNSKINKLESLMNRKPKLNNYEQRLTAFLTQIKSVETGAKKEDLYSIMDTPVFRDLETALMMATMEQAIQS